MQFDLLYNPGFENPPHNYLIQCHFTNISAVIVTTDSKYFRKYRMRLWCIVHSAMKPLSESWFRRRHFD